MSSSPGELFIPFSSSAPLNSWSSKNENDFVENPQKSGNEEEKSYIVLYPWLQSHTRQEYHDSPLIHFHNEILQFCQFAYPTSKEMKEREEIIQRVTEVAKFLWPTCEVTVFGSHMTKLLSFASDIDIAICSVPTIESEMSSTTSELECLYQLSKHLKYTQTFSYIEVISNAKVPIIKCDDKSTKIAIDICINNDSGTNTGTNQCGVKLRRNLCSNSY